MSIKQCNFKIQLSNILNLNHSNPLRVKGTQNIQTNYFLLQAAQIIRIKAIVV